MIAVSPGARLRVVASAWWRAPAHQSRRPWRRAPWLTFHNSRFAPTLAVAGFDSIGGSHDNGRLAARIAQLVERSAFATVQWTVATNARRRQGCRLECAPWMDAKL